MANPIVEGSKLINGLSIYEVSGTPDQGTGVKAYVGSVALSNDAGVASFWQKTGSLDTQWQQVGGGGGGTITGGVNLGLGTPVFNSVIGTDLAFATLNAGNNITLTTQLDGSVTITGTGGGGAPTGDANKVAYFDGTNPHPLTDNLFFTFYPPVPAVTPAILGVGVQNPTGNIQIAPNNPSGYTNADYCVAILGFCDPAQQMGTGVLLFGGVGNLATTNYCLANNSLVGGVNSRISAGEGSVAIGNNVTVNGENSVAFGFNTIASGPRTVATGDSTLAVGERSFAANGFNTTFGDSSSAFGNGHNVQAFQCFAVGQYSNAPGSNNLYVPEEPAFVVGNGASDLTRNNAFEVDKDGKIITTGAQQHKAIKLVTADYAVSARTDRTILVDSSAVVSTLTVTLPSGEDGLEFFIKDVGYSADSKNIVIATQPGQFIEATSDITNNGSSRHFQYFAATSTWYNISMP